MPIELVSVAALIFSGLLLLVVELVFVPGVSIMGVFGFLLSVAGVWMSYAVLGSEQGHQVLGFTVAANLVAGFVGYRSNVWRKVRQQKAAKKHQAPVYGLIIGEVGTTVSDLNPGGQARFHARVYPVRSTGRLVQAGTEVRIIRIKRGRIIVEPLT